MSMENVDLSFTDGELKLLECFEGESRENIAKSILEKKYGLMQSDFDLCKCKQKHAFGEKAIDAVIDVFKNIIENSDKIIDVVDYAKSLKDDYDRKYHPEKIEQQ